MKKVGIIGVESKHAEFFGKLINVDKAYPGFFVEAIAPIDKADRLPYVLERCPIKKICDSAEELIDSCDCVLLITRLPQTHYALAMKCLDAGKPVFVDKPFTASVGEAKELLEVSLKKGLTLLGGSSLCFDPSIKLNLAQIKSSPLTHFKFTADPESPFGGYAFYLSHLTDLCTSIYGETHLVSASRKGNSISSLVRHASGIALLSTSLEPHECEIIYEQQGKSSLLTLSDTNCYQNGLNAFFAAVNGAPSSNEYLSQSVALIGEITNFFLNQ
ncbi:MAG: Gfo/Idh/MocA family oxidoreductase [Oscillospiraceae bacterium]